MSSSSGIWVKILYDFFGNVYSMRNISKFYHHHLGYVERKALMTSSEITLIKTCGIHKSIKKILIRSSDTMRDGINVAYASYLEILKVLLLKWDK